MGGGSDSTSHNNSRTEYSNTTTSNPYVTSKTTNDGTTTKFTNNNILNQLYKQSNKDFARLYDELVNPNYNSQQNQAKLKAYTDTMNSETQKALENNIIYPLAQRNMLRSSQASDLYRDLANQQTKGIQDFENQLVANSPTAQDALTNIMNMVFQGYNVLQGNQAQSLQTSAGNAYKEGYSRQSGSSYGL